ncbi:MAG: response regulator [Planctomycetota bacterium]
MTESERETILVVDDNAANRLLAEAMLQTAGYKTVLVENGSQALETFTAKRPDLILLDLLMPGMDGFETFKRLRALPGGAFVPIVIVTALTDLASVQKAIELTADDFLAKPVNRVELLARIRTLLGKRRKAVELIEPPTSGISLSHLERERQREQLSAMVVHDLKHPLSAIYFNAGMLKRDMSVGMKPQEKVERILRACETLNGMVMTLLDINRSEGGSLPLTLGEFDAATLLDEVATSMGVKAEAHGQKVVVSLHGAPLTVRGDRDVLRRVLENLIDNASKYAGPRTTIRLECRRGDRVVDFSVADEGPGIPAGLRDKVFDKYLQLDDSARRSPGSRGIGLVFCRMAVEAHQGKIWVEQNEPQGSRFRITLPSEAA